MGVKFRVHNRAFAEILEEAKSSFGNTRPVFNVGEDFRVPLQSIIKALPDSGTFPLYRKADSQETYDVDVSRIMDCIDKLIDGCVEYVAVPRQKRIRINTDKGIVESENDVVQYMLNNKPTFSTIYALEYYGERVSQKDISSFIQSTWLEDNNDWLNVTVAPQKTNIETRLIIVDGVDRIGKSTKIINPLQHILGAFNRNVPMWGGVDETDIPENKPSNYYEALMLAATNELNLMYQIAVSFNVPIILDRFMLSNRIFNRFRRLNTYKVFGSLIMMDKYARYVEEWVQERFTHVHQYTFVHKKDEDNKSDGHWTDAQSKEINRLFKIFHDESAIKNKRLIELNQGDDISGNVERILNDF